MEWYLISMEQSAKPEECLGQANLSKVRVFNQSLGFKNTISRESGAYPVKGRARKLLWWPIPGLVATRRTFWIEIPHEIEGMEPHSNGARHQT